MKIVSWVLVAFLGLTSMYYEHIAKNHEKANNAAIWMVAAMIGAHS